MTVRRHLRMAMDRLLQDLRVCDVADIFQACGLVSSTTAHQLAHSFGRAVLDGIHMMRQQDNQSGEEHMCQDDVDRLTVCIRALECLLPDTFWRELVMQLVDFSEHDPHDSHDQMSFLSSLVNRAVHSGVEVRLVRILLLHGRHLEDPPLPSRTIYSFRLLLLVSSLFGDEEDHAVIKLRGPSFLDASAPSGEFLYDLIDIIRIAHEIPFFLSTEINCDRCAEWMVAVFVKHASAFQQFLEQLLLHTSSLDLSKLCGDSRHKQTVESIRRAGILNVRLKGIVETTLRRMLSPDSLPTSAQLRETTICTLSSVLDHENAWELLATCVHTDPDASVRIRCLHEMTAVGCGERENDLLLHSTLQDPVKGVRRLALQKLVEHTVGNPQVELLLAKARDRDAQIRVCALRALENHPNIPHALDNTSSELLRQVLVGGMMDKCDDVRAASKALLRVYVRDRGIDGILTLQRLHRVGMIENLALFRDALQGHIMEIIPL